MFLTYVGESGSTGNSSADALSTSIDLKIRRVIDVSRRIMSEHSADDFDVDLTVVSFIGLLSHLMLEPSGGEARRLGRLVKLPIAH